jgi:hypothetical protein
LKASYTAAAAAPAAAQRLAALPAPVFEEVRSGKKKRSEALRQTRTGSPAGPAKPPTPPEEPKDSVGQVIPEKLRPVFARRQEITSRMTQLSTMKAEVIKSHEDKDALFYNLSTQRFQAAMENARRELHACVPYAVCPYCKGRGCQACHAHGFLDQYRYDSAPKEMKRVQK